MGSFCSFSTVQLKQQISETFPIIRIIFFSNLKMSLARNIVTVINLGRMGFLTAADLQSRYARQHLDFLAGKPGAISRNVILMVEHDPVYTTGFRTESYGEEEEKKLKSHGAEFYRTNRGGLITYHGPGQLVAYPILNLLQFRPSMKWYVHTLEQALIETCAQWGITAQRTKDTGVWVEDRKIAALGVHGSRYVTTHGISLNCNTDLSWFKLIVPCGLKGKEVTSISKELDKDISIQDVTKTFLESFELAFNCQIETSLLENHEHIFIPHRAAFLGDNVAISPPISTQSVQAKRMLSTFSKKEEKDSVITRMPMW